MIPLILVRAPVIVAAMCAGALPATIVAQEVSLPLGTQAPQADLQDLEGNPVDLLDYVPRGKPALIEFWAAWCENCAALQPQLNQIHARWGDRIDIVAVAVAVGQTPRRVQRVIEEHDPGYPYLWDGDGAAVRAYRATTTSVVVMLDDTGKIVYTGVGPDQDLIAEVKKLVGTTVRPRRPGWGSPAPRLP